VKKIIQGKGVVYYSSSATVGDAPLWIVGPEGDLDVVRHEVSDSRSLVSIYGGKASFIERKYEPKPRRMLRLKKGE
jgi:hypothetical protein